MDSGGNLGPDVAIYLCPSNQKWRQTRICPAPTVASAETSDTSLTMHNVGQLSPALANGSCKEITSACRKSRGNALEDF